MKLANQDKYLLSVVIPTRNRQEYTIQAINQILSVTNEKTQIVIQDNSDTDQLREKINELESSRILYSYSKDVLSFVDNFEVAVSLAEGSYIILIGDDDGILPSINEIVEYAIKNDIDTITSKILATYYWPHSGAVSYKCTEENGYIRIHNFSKTVKRTNNEEIIKKVLKNGCQFYFDSGLPKLYHGIVKKELLESIKQKYGRLFYGLSPDIYSSFLISINTNKSVIVDFPFSIDGNCPKSGAGAQAQGKHTGSLKNAPHFKGHKNYIWDEKVPYVYSVQTIWADSALKALKSSNRGDLIDYFNKEKLTLYTMLNNFSIKKETFESYLKLSNYPKVIAIYKLFVASFNGPITNIITRFFRRVIGLGQVGYIINNVPNIQKASDEIINYLNKDKEK